MMILDEHYWWNWTRDHFDRCSKDRLGTRQLPSGFADLLPEVIRATPYPRNIELDDIASQTSMPVTVRVCCSYGSSFVGSARVCWMLTCFDPNVLLGRDSWMICPKGHRGGPWADDGVKVILAFLRSFQKFNQTRVNGETRHSLWTVTEGPLSAKGVFWLH